MKHVRRPAAVFLAALLVLLVAAGVVRSRSSGYTRPSRHDAETIQPLANRFLVSAMGPVEFPSMKHGRWFCLSHLLGTRRRATDRVDAYLWILCDEVAPTAAGGLSYGTGFSPPIVLHLTRHGRVLTPAAYDQPGDGSYYEPGVKRMFPGSLASFVLSHPHDVAPTEAQIRAEAMRAFYG